MLQVPSQSLHPEDSSFDSSLFPLHSLPFIKTYASYAHFLSNLQPLLKETSQEDNPWGRDLSTPSLHLCQDSIGNKGFIAISGD